MPKQIQRDLQPNKPEFTYQRIITTGELPFAAYLKAKYRLPLSEVRRSSSGRVTWTFEIQDQDETTLINEFIRGGMVAAAEYFSELRNLKSTTYTI